MGHYFGFNGDYLYFMGTGKLSIIRDQAALTTFLSSVKEDERLGFVPTMGALHEGHLSLVRRSLSENQATIVSIFVNPSQFSETEDFSDYPRTEAADLALLSALGVDAVFLPTQAMIYPEGPEQMTRISVPQLSKQFCGVSRPHFFDGVAQVLLRFFVLLAPDRAYFGEKDFQQLVIVKRLIRDFSLPIESIGCPLLRDPDSLAMSSRNRYLSTEQRQLALTLPKALFAMREAAQSGECEIEALISLGRNSLLSSDRIRLDYLAIVDENCQSLSSLREDARAIAAIYLDDLRLLDNCSLLI